MKIRLLKLSDLPLRSAFLTEASNSAGITIDLPMSDEKSHRWFDKISLENNRLDFSFIQANTTLGFGGLVNIQHKHKTAELYIFLGQSYQHQGYGKVALELMLAIAKYEIGLRKILLYTVSDNNSANKFYENLGFIQEGFLKQHIWHRGKYVDRYIYSLFLESIVLDHLDIYESIA